MTGPGTSSFGSSDDLTHLVGPLTEESLVKYLQGRFHAGYCQTCIGPQLVCVNGFTRPPELRVLTSDSGHSTKKTSVNISLNSSTSGAFPSPSSPQTPVSALPSPLWTPGLGLPTPPVGPSSPARLPVPQQLVRDNSNAATASYNVSVHQHQTGGPSGLPLSGHHRQSDLLGPRGEGISSGPHRPLLQRSYSQSDLQGYLAQGVPGGSRGLPSLPGHRQSDMLGLPGQGTQPWQTRGPAPHETDSRVNHHRHSSSTSSCSELQALHQGLAGGQPPPQFMEGMVRTVLSQHADSFHPQVILVSGESGSGKTHSSMEMLRLLLEAAGGGSQTDAFKYLSAALTVVRAMSSALTVANADSSRVVSGQRPGHVHRECDVRLSRVQNKNSLSVCGYEPCDVSASSRAELPHLLPDVGRPVWRGAG
ncbi:myosin IB heavy chain [Elysia marginata]|uniref:Myosin IB heavy chain n=1 Tax=Elysia marginata TaxID=1093978 RepID=A0AAV4HH63_9GAST|nr:myosin IB heavy chain [Elysia marginata]